MAVHNPTETRDRLRQFAQRADVMNAHAQAQARAILRRTNTPPSEWPHFSEDLDRRVHHAAHRLIWGALEILEVEQFVDDAKEFLLQGAEALEFLYSDPSTPAELRTDELLKAAFAYHIAGHGARAFVLMADTLSSLPSLPDALALAVAVLQRNPMDARLRTIAVYRNDSLLDDSIAQQVTEGEVTVEEAVTRMVSRSTARSVSFYLEYVKTGDRAFLAEAFNVIENTIILARESRLVDWWWWAFCIRFLFREFEGSSLWTTLAPMFADDQGDGPVRRYVLAGLRQTPPVLELWPSQIQAISTITDPARPDFCLRMPTSSGKTRIAELTILRFILDHRHEPNLKCVYIAPFRSLAVEVEKALKRAIEPLGERISEVYGGFELSPAERTEVEANRVLVATPEKFDALLRFVPELGNQIRLLIFDEGHIVNPDIRGLRFEILIQRCIKRFRGTGCRLLFISAVLPNSAQFTEWITGTPQNLVASQWRPSRLMLGKVTWDGKRVGLVYTHRGEQQMGHDCFVRTFIESRQCHGVAGFGRRRKPFPSDQREALAGAALMFAQDGVTLIFTAQTGHADAAAKDLDAALKCISTLHAFDGGKFELPVPGRGTETWNRCWQVIRDEMGESSEYLKYFEIGFVVHHSRLPRRVRLAVEDVVREGGIRLIVATTTLAQGVNLPIKTVLVRHLYHSQNELISPLTFWNICGRAGRAMKENEGQILFFTDLTADAHARRKRDREIHSLISTLQASAVTSALRLALLMILRRWLETHPSVDMTALCERLVENDVSWAAESQRSGLENWLDILDGHLLALTEELDVTADSPDRLQAVLEGSLLFIQLRDSPKRELDRSGAIQLLHSRVRYVFSQLPEKRTRVRMYKLGMTLTSCRFVEQKRDALTKFVLQAADWDAWSDEQRLKYFLSLAGFLLQIRDIGAEVELPPQRDAILTHWLAGTSVAHMASDPAIALYSSNPAEIALFIEDICGYRLPWGANSVLAYVNEFLTEAGGSAPAVCGYFAAMFKYGVLSATATCITPHIDQRRDLALAAARVCPHHYAEPARVVAWFMNASDMDLILAGLPAETVADILATREAAQQLRRTTTSQRRHKTMRFRLARRTLPEDVSRFCRVLLVPADDSDPNAVELFSIAGSSIGVFRIPQPIPDWWRRPHLLDASVESVEPESDGRIVLTVKFLEL